MVAKKSSSRKRSLPSGGASKAKKTRTESSAVKAGSNKPVQVAANTPYECINGIPLSEQKPDVSKLKDPLPVRDSNTLRYSLERSRNIWLTGGMFETYWTRPPRGRKLASGEVNAREKMSKLCECTMIVGPHFFDVKLFTVKDDDDSDPKDDPDARLMEIRKKEYEKKLQEQKDHQQKVEEEHKKREQEFKQQQLQHQQQIQHQQQQQKQLQQQQMQRQQQLLQNDTPSKPAAQARPPYQSTSPANGGGGGKYAQVGMPGPSPGHTKVHKPPFSSSGQSGDSKSEEKSPNATTTSSPSASKSPEPAASALKPTIPSSQIPDSIKNFTPSHLRLSQSIQANPGTPVTLSPGEPPSQTSTSDTPSKKPFVPATYNPDQAALTKLSKPIVPLPPGVLEMPSTPSLTSNNGNGSPAPSTPGNSSIATQEQPAQQTQQAQQVQQVQQAQQAEQGQQQPQSSGDSPSVPNANPSNQLTIARLQAIARVDPALSALMRIVATGNATNEQMTAFQLYIQKAKTMDLPPGVLVPSASSIGLNRSPHTPQYPKVSKPSKQPKPKVPKLPKLPAMPRKPKAPYQSKKLQKNQLVVFEFKDNPTSRYVLPKDSIVEVLRNGTILVSFLAVHNRKAIKPEKKQKKKEESAKGSEVKSEPAEKKPAAEPLRRSTRRLTREQARLEAQEQAKKEAREAKLAKKKEAAEAQAKILEEDVPKESSLLHKVDDSKPYFTAVTLAIRGTPRRSIPVIERSVTRQDIVYNRMEQILKDGVRSKDSYVWYQFEKADASRAEKLADHAPPPVNQMVPGRKREYKPRPRKEGEAPRGRRKKGDRTAADIDDMAEKEMHAELAAIKMEEEGAKNLGSPADVALQGSAPPTEVAPQGSAPPTEVAPQGTAPTEAGATIEKDSIGVIKEEDHTAPDDISAFTASEERIAAAEPTVTTKPASTKTEQAPEASATNGDGDVEMANT